MSLNKNDIEHAIAQSRRISHWNYRVLESPDLARIIEVFYDRRGDIVAWVEDTAIVAAWTRNELAGEVAHLAEALGRPSLTRDDLPVEDAWRS